MVQLVKILSNNSAAKSTTYLGDDGQAYVLTGDLAQRANNPGNISPTGTRGLYESQFGAIGYLPSSPGQPAVAVFPTLDAGTQAQQYLWSTPAYQNKTIAQAASSWASAPYTAQLAQAAGVAPDTKISDLSPQQMTAIFAAQGQAEGSSNLRVSDASGNPLPASVIRGGSAPNVTTNTAGPDDRPSMASLYGAPPAPLTPPGVFGNRLPAAAMNGLDRSRPPGVPPIPEPIYGYGGAPATPDDPNYGLPDPALSSTNSGDPLSAQMSSLLAPQPAPSAPRSDPLGSGLPSGDAFRAQLGLTVPQVPLPQSRNSSIGMVAPGNIDINNRPVYFGNDGTYGTERSFSIGTDKGEVLIPQIVGGKLVSQQAAIDHYMQTGENLGTFSTPDAADAFAQQLHERDQGLANMPVPMPGRPAALGVTAPPVPSFLPTGQNWSVPKPPAAPQQLVRLPSGQMIAPGTYPSPSNPGSFVTVSGDASGNAVMKVTDPGIAGGIKPGTIAGSMVGKAIADAAGGAGSAVQSAASNAGANIAGAASNLGSQAAALGGNIGNMFGNLFNRTSPQSSLPPFVPTGPNWMTPKPPAQIPSIPANSTGAKANGSDGWPSTLSPTVYVRPDGSTRAPDMAGSSQMPLDYRPQITASKPSPPSLPSFMPSGQNWSSPVADLGAPVSIRPPAPTTINVANPAYAAWQAQYGNQGGLSTGTSQNTVSAKFNDSDGWAAPVAPPVIPPAPPKFVTKTIPASIGAVPPVPMGNPSWLAPVMPQSSVILPKFVTQAIGATKPGLLDFARFLSGSQNNGSYVTPQNGMSQLDTHYALLAQQGHQSPVATSAPSSGSYLQGALASAAKGNNNAIDYYNKVNG